MIMKRLIVISVVFALVAGTAFADVNVGGAVFGKVNVLQGTSEKFVDPNNAKTPPTAADNDAVNSDSIRAGGAIGRIRLELSGQNDDGTFGGWARFEGTSVQGYGNAWWKPIDQVKLLIGGSGGDGFFGKDGVTRWGFYQGAGDIGIANETWAFGNSFYGGFSGNGAVVTISPLEALEINVAVPFFDLDGKRAEWIYKNTNAQVAYNIDGIGDLAVTYVGSYQGDNDGPFANTNLERNDKVAFYPVGLDQNGYGTIDIVKDKYQGGPAYSAAITNKFFAYFNLSAVENLGLQIGLGFTVPAKQEDVEEGDIMGQKYKATSTYTYNTPVAIGLGASYDAGAFGIKARVQAEVGHSAKGVMKYESGSTSETTEYEVKGPVVLTFSILPSFAINDSMKAFLSVGVTSTGKYNALLIEANTTPGGKDVQKDVERDSSASWHVNPYLTKSAGAGTFYAGFRMWGNNREQYVASINDKLEKTEKPIINWAVPIGVAFNF